MMSLYQLFHLLQVHLYGLSTPLCRPCRRLRPSCLTTPRRCSGPSARLGQRPGLLHQASPRLGTPRPWHNSHERCLQRPPRCSRRHQQHPLCCLWPLPRLQQHPLCCLWQLPRPQQHPLCRLWQQPRRPLWPRLLPVSTMSTPGALHQLLLLHRRHHHQLPLLLAAPTSSHLHHGSSKLIVHVLLVLSPSHRSTILMA